MREETLNETMRSTAWRSLAAIGPCDKRSLRRG